MKSVAVQLFVKCLQRAAFPRGAQGDQVSRDDVTFVIVTKALGKLAEWLHLLRRMAIDCHLDPGGKGQAVLSAITKIK